MAPDSGKAPPIQEAIRQVLRQDWDPIGVRDFAPPDEYDFYAGGLYRLLRSSKSEDALIDFLAHAEAELMSSPASSSLKLQGVARKLLSLSLPSDDA